MCVLRTHKIKTLPVLERAGRVTGVLTLVDSMKHATLEIHEGFEAR